MNQNKRGGWGLTLGGFLLCCCIASGAVAQSLPLEDKARYEKALEQKVDDVLLRLLGPNQAKVLVQASMDFTRTEKVEINSGAISGEKDALFRWQNITEAEQSGPQLLPGFPVASSFNPLGGENKSYQREMLFAPSFLKKLSVTIVINREIGPAEAENIKGVVSDLLGIDLKRGDDLVMVRAPFAPLWKTIWYNPESVSLVFKYGMLTLMAIMGMIVVAVGFLKLAGAMNTMAKSQQSHQISMELGKAGLPGGTEGDILGLEEKRALPGPGKGTAEAEPEGAEFFRVKPEQVPFMVSLLGKEDPANIALITVNLAPDVRGAFMKSLPVGISSEIIANMAKVRFVEPEVIATLKDELERRLSGAMGGVEKVMEVLEKVSLKAKKEMIGKLAEKHPEIAASVRCRVLFLEDLARLADKELSMLVSEIKVEDWASAAWGMPEELKERVRAQMADKTWRMIEQTMTYGTPSDEKIEKAIEGVVETAGKLIREGRILDPLAPTNLLTSSPAAISPPQPLSAGDAGAAAI